MKTARSLYSCLAAALLIVLASAGMAAAQCSEVPTGSGFDLSDSCYGYEALNVEQSPSGGNSAFGKEALFSNTTGDYNTADGVGTLYANTTGSNNTATGAYALSFNTTGDFNTAAGENALVHNTTGRNNTATGLSALFSNTTGSNNIGIGYYAGQYLTTGNNNIDIGSNGSRYDARTIRIGKPGTQTATYIAGIKDSAVTGVADLVVTSAGQLGMMASSARYKRDIHDMGASSAGLMKLRPVTFRYKDDPDGARQYGLVAEEVARVYPELVVHGADGKVESVRYSTLISMLLNELQKQAAQMADMKASMRRQAAELKASRERELAMRTAFEERLSRLEQVMASKDGSRNLATAFNR